MPPPTLADIFDRGRFMIYPWPVPRPTDFTSLSDGEKLWKRKFDIKAKMDDIDDGADDWYALDETLDARTAGSVFMVRAKRAFWSGKSWDQFAEDERTGYSEATARKTDPMALTNAFRMQIFDAVKERLCEEIWLEPYHDPPSLVVKLPVGDGVGAGRKRRADSHLPTPSRGSSSRATVTLGRMPRGQPRSTVVRAVQPASAEESDMGIKGWTVDPDSIRQPFYGEETEAPHGMAKFMHDMRTQQAAEGESSQQAMLSSAGTSQGPTLADSANPVFEQPLDMSTSDEDEA